MPDGTEVLLRVEHLKKEYETAQGPVPAIGDLTFDVRRGELVCIVGPSGAGKTTLLKCIAGLLAPTSGSMGYGLPAAIAAKLADPTRTVVNYAGDGCFMMTGQ